MSTPHKFATLKGKRTISLTTYYKSGKPVATPVDCGRFEDKLYVSTPEASYKVRRVRGNSKAVIASCTMRGKLTGPEIDVQVKILSEEEGKVAKEALDAVHLSFFYRVMLKLLSWRNKEKKVYLEIS